MKSARKNAKKRQPAVMGMMGCHGQLSRLGPATKQRLPRKRHDRQRDRTVILSREVNEWEQLFWEKLKAFLVQIGDDRVEEKERLTREWRTDCWKRLNLQMHASLKRLAGFVSGRDKEFISERWTSSISQLVEEVEKPNSISLSDLRSEIEEKAFDQPEIRPRMEEEIEDTLYRLKRGFDRGRFDQFWDDDTLFKCRYSQSKWLYLKPHSSVPLGVYSHALKGNKKITHITFGGSESDVNWFQATIRG